jgi:hypothetical protein
MCICAFGQPCDSNPCENRGSCWQPTPSTYACACDLGYTGADCETPFSLCASNPCQNGGYCTIPDVRAVVGFNNFDAEPARSTLFFDSGDVSTSHALVNNFGTQPYVVSTSRSTTAGQIPYTAFWTRRNAQSMNDGAPLGVRIANGSNAYVLADTDGTVTLTFGAVSTSVHRVLRVSLDLFISTGTWDSEDLFSVSVRSGGSSGPVTQLLSWSGAHIMQNSLANAWHALVFNVTDTSSVQVIISASSGHDSEFFFIDNVVVSGRPHRYDCLCEPGFVGVHCETDVNECESSPCQNGGTCSQGSSPDLCECTCAPGFVGINCETDVNECDSSPCINGGTCFQDVPGEFICVCLVGWTGHTCHVDFDECASSPCVFGACSSGGLINNWVCTCSAGWTGPICDVDINECLSSPCTNGGSCSDPSDSPGFFVCTCPPGFTDVDCSGDFDECTSSPCQNGATCQQQSQPYTFTCTCAPGFTGQLCETDINECESSPCRNGGTCNQGSSPFLWVCVCPPGFSGQRCELDRNECKSSPCTNGGTCWQGRQPNLFMCFCPRGFTGRRCESDVNECNSFPCLNGGTCSQTAGPAVYVCACPPGFTGLRCEVDVNECASSPCQNGATCSQFYGPDVFVCDCVSGYTGTLCDSGMSLCASNPCTVGTCVEKDRELVLSQTFESEPAGTWYVDVRASSLGHDLVNNRKSSAVVDSTVTGTGVWAFDASFVPTRFGSRGLSVGSLVGVADSSVLPWTSGSQAYVLTNTRGQFVLKFARVSLTDTTFADVELYVYFRASSTFDRNDRFSVELVTDAHTVTLLSVDGTRMAQLAGIPRRLGSRVRGDWVELVVRADLSRSDELVVIDNARVYKGTLSYECV